MTESIKLIEIYPLTIADITPKNSGKKSIETGVPQVAISALSSKTADKMIGILIKKVKSALSCLFTPAILPNKIVLPLLEMPVKTPTACPHPIIKAVFLFIGRKSLFSFEIFLQINISKAVIKKVIESKIGALSNSVSIDRTFEKIMPTIPAGIDAKIRLKNKLGLIKSPKIFFLSIIITGIKVPKCNTTL